MRLHHQQGSKLPPPAIAALPHALAASLWMSAVIRTAAGYVRCYPLHPRMFLCFSLEAFAAVPSGNCKLHGRVCVAHADLSGSGYAAPSHKLCRTPFFLSLFLLLFSSVFVLEPFPVSEMSII
jgi:hypothetical protein